MYDDIHISYNLMFEIKFDKDTNSLAFFIILKIAMTYEYETDYLKLQI